VKKAETLFGSKERKADHGQDLGWVVPQRRTGKKKTKEPRPFAHRPPLSEGGGLSEPPELEKRGVGGMKTGHKVPPGRQGLVFHNRVGENGTKDGKKTTLGVEKGFGKQKDG